MTTPFRIRVTETDGTTPVSELALAGLEHGPFQSSGWIDSWLDAFRPADRRLIVASIETAGGRVAFALPLVRERRSGLSVLTLPDCGFTDYNAPLVAANFQPTPAVFAALWNELVRALPRADLLAIEKSPASVGGVANPLAFLATRRASKFAAHPLRLDRPFADLAAERFDGSLHRSLVKKRRKLSAKGDLAFTFATGSAALEDLDRIQAWRAGRFREVLCSDALVRGGTFYRALVTAERARVGKLTLDGRLIGGCLGVLDTSGFRLLMVGHDEAFKNWSPGLLAIENAIEWSVEAGLPVFDFTIGEERYKLDFGARPEPLLELVEPMSLKGVLYVAYHRTRSMLRERAPGSEHAGDIGRAAHA